jgi:hypothetical protein
MNTVESPSCNSTWALLTNKPISTVILRAGNTVVITFKIGFKIEFSVLCPWLSIVVDRCPGFQWSVSCLRGIIVAGHRASSLGPPLLNITFFHLSPSPTTSEKREYTSVVL